MKTLLQLKTILLLGCFGGTMLWGGFQRLANSGEDASIVFHAVSEVNADGAQWIY
ncbi:MAG: hypothetical protein ACRBFS_02570 [Aureispira sp.]